MATVLRKYLFVNKNKQSASLSSSSGKESSLILSHVQHVCVDRRKLQRGRGLYVARTTTTKTTRREPTDNYSNNSTGHMCETCSAPCSYEFGRIHEPASRIHAGLDQFRATTMAIDRHARELLTYHVEWWRAIAPKWKSWHEVDLSQPADVVITQKCFQNPLYLLSIITFSSVQMEMLKFSCARPARSNQLHAKTISALREAVSKAYHNPMQLLEILSYMCLTEVFRCNPSAGRMHLGAVRHLLGIVGGISKVVNYASEMFLFSDFYLALSSLSQSTLGHCINFNDKPPLLVESVLETANAQLQGYPWINKLSHRTLKWAVQQLVFCVHTLQHSWTDKAFVMNGFWVRKKCVSVIICLLDVWSFENIPSHQAEAARITILLWSTFLLASTLDTQGAKNYIPLFDQSTIERYRAVGLVRVSSALYKWNEALAYEFGPIPLGCDVLLRVLLKVPSGLEPSGGVCLGELMEQFASAEQNARWEKVINGVKGEAERHHRWRIWRTSILLS